MNSKVFSLEILNKLGNYHRNLMKEISNVINNFKTNKQIYEYIDDYITKNKLNKAFPIGISINHVIAHDSYHESNILKLNEGDFIKIDVGLIEYRNIIDSARTFIYNNLETPQSIIDSKNICKQVEEYIRKKIENEGKIKIQAISILINMLITTKGYSNLDFLGGHTIEYNKVHGSQYILNKPLNLLPKQASNYIDSNAEIGEGEMFAIEIYIGDKKYSGNMVKSIKIPVTHYQLNKKEEIEKLKLDKDELEIINNIFLETGGLVYEYKIHKKFNIKIIKKLIDNGIIIKHEALEFISNFKEKIKYVQYEDCFIINNGELLNLSE